MSLSKRVESLETKKPLKGKDMQIVMLKRGETSEQAQIRHCQERGITLNYLNSPDVLIWEIQPGLYDLDEAKAKNEKFDFDEFFEALDRDCKGER